MSVHKPIKFEVTLEPSLIRQLKWIMENNKEAKTIKNAILALAAVGGILTLGAMAPNALGMIGKFLEKSKNAHKQRYRQIWNSFYRLKKQREFEFVEEKDGITIYRITNKGRDAIRKVIFDEISLAKPQRWDGNWHLVVFDIPEGLKNNRTALRNKLTDLGFYQCQKSVWIHPFPCLGEIEFLKQELDIEPYVKIFTVNEMTDGKVLYFFKDQLKEAV